MRNPKMVVSLTSGSTVVVYHIAVGMQPVRHVFAQMPNISCLLCGVGVTDIERWWWLHLPPKQCLWETVICKNQRCIGWYIHKLHIMPKLSSIFLRGPWNPLLHCLQTLEKRWRTNTIFVTSSRTQAQWRINHHLYFENVAFFHAKRGSDGCIRINNQTFGDTSQE